ncbi:Protein DA1-related 1 [Vitis vinifera]|uniref:Protein DA1-related 1 n=1 Tax=Vitis vinifera TaxID=29760 RepID=A0A438I6N8_VITVI|nr:Protein DA1-related 1 [Vitis vinifera]
MRYDCGMFAIKYMEHWNGATLAHSIAEDKMHLYRLRLVVTLVTNAVNNARDKVRSSKRAMKYEKLLKVEEIDFYSAYYLAKLILLYERMVELPRIAGFFIPLLKKWSMEYAGSGVAGSILAISCCGGSLFIYPKFSSRSVYQRFMEIPTNPAGLIEYRAHPFRVQKYCPSREHDRTPRCCSCERMEPRDTRYVALNEGRKLCLECLDSAIMDTNECQPLYLDIQEFYEGLNMKVQQQVPLLLVERQALNEAMEGEKSGHHHMLETRGLCLSEEQTVSTILRRPKIGTGKRVMNMITEPCKLTRRCDVTAVLILYGLPSSSTQQPLNADLLAFLLRSQSLLTSCLEDYWAAYDRSGYDNADFSSSQLQKIAERNALHQTQSTGTKDTTSSSLTLDAQQKVTDLMARRNPGKIPHSGNKLSKVSVVGHAAILAAIKKYMPSLDCTLSCTMNGHKSVVSALAVSDGVLYSGSWDGTIRLWSLNDHSPLTVLGEDTRGNVISVLSLKADHHMLLAAHEDGYLKCAPLQYYEVTGQEGIGIYQIANAFMEMVVHRRLGQECQCTGIAGDDLQIEALPVGSIASDSAVIALLYWQGKLFVGCADRIIKEQDKRIEELTAELENASQRCEAYRASLLAALKIWRERN